MNDKIKLYEIKTGHCKNGDYYMARSLYNKWTGLMRPVKGAAESDGEKHQRALEYLFKGNKIQKSKKKFWGIVKRVLVASYVFYITTNMALGYTSGDQIKVIFCGFCLVLFELALILGK